MVALANRTSDKGARWNGTQNEIYAQALNTDGDGLQEVWPAIVAKAYAVFCDRYVPERMSRDGYDCINAGWASDAIDCILGTPAHQVTISPAGGDRRLLAMLSRGAQDPVVADTPDEDDLPSGLVKNHSYTVLGTMKENGIDYVVLRNPWGNTEPGSDGADDGVFRLTLAELRSAFVRIHTTHDLAAFDPFDPFAFFR